MSTSVPSYSESVSAPQSAAPVDAAHILRGVGAIMAEPADAQWLETLVVRCVADLGADVAWVYAEARESGQPLLLVCSLGAGGTGSDLETASIALQAALGRSGSALHLDGAQAPWLTGMGAGCCVAHAIAGVDGAAGAHLALAFRQAPACTEAYVHALQALAAFVRHAVLERQQAQQNIRQLHQMVAQYKAVFQSAPVLVNVFGVDGTCLMWNDECERRFGWSMDEINAHAEPWALFYPDPQVRARVLTSVSTEPSRSFLEWHPVTRDGEVLTTLWSNTRMVNGQVINIGMDITERRKAEAAIVRLVKMDGLTGCWSRAEIMERLVAMLGRACEGGQGFIAMMLDLDHFKQINDRYGHLGGDAALKHFCEHLRTCLRDEDALGRLGGEEFLVLLSTTDVRTSHAVFERMRSNLRSQPLLLETDPIVLAASAGVTVYQSGDSMAADLLKRADLALYQAKRQGRDRVVMYQPGA